MTDPTDPTTTPQIWVSPTAVPGNTMTAVRDLLKIAAMGAATHGFIRGDQVETIVSALCVIAPILWSQYVSWRNNRKMKLMEQHVPARIAQLK